MPHLQTQLRRRAQSQGWSQASALAPQGGWRGGSLLLTDRPLVPMPSIALGPRDSQHKRAFLGAVSLAIFTLGLAGPASETELHKPKNIAGKHLFFFPLGRLLNSTDYSCLCSAVFLTPWGAPVIHNLTSSLNSPGSSTLPGTQQKVDKSLMNQCMGTNE